MTPANECSDIKPGGVQPAGVTHVGVDERSAGQRVDNFLLRTLPGIPKSHIYRLLRSGQVRVDGGRAKPERRLLVGQTVRIPPVRIAEPGAVARPPDALRNRLRQAVIFEDGSYLAICKPAGVSVHRGTGVPYGVIEVARSWHGYPYLELVHRLDRDTSGILLLAKSRSALLRAHEALRDGTAVKRYYALLVGKLDAAVRDVDAALFKGRLSGGERYVSIDAEGGKESISRFVTRAYYQNATFCEVQIFSGRTHQIRVHALALGHPVAGDPKYGPRAGHKRFHRLGLRRMFLHACYLELPPIQDGQVKFPRLVLAAPMSEELCSFLERLS